MTLPFQDQWEKAHQSLGCASKLWFPTFTKSVVGYAVMVAPSSTMNPEPTGLTEKVTSSGGTGIPKCATMCASPVRVKGSTGSVTSEIVTSPDTTSQYKKPTPNDSSASSATGTSAKYHAV